MGSVIFASHQAEKSSDQQAVLWLRLKEIFKPSDQAGGALELPYDYVTKFISKCQLFASESGQIHLL